MPDYKNGKIYAIRSNMTDKIYIGSTTQRLSKRFYDHKCDFKKGYSITSRKILCFDDAYIELIELFPCNSKIELHKREGELIRAMDCVNKFVPCRTGKEYREDNKDKISKRQKEYRGKNKDKIADYGKEYYEKNKDKINKHKKEYNATNKDKIKMKMKEYYEKNKDKIDDYRKEYYEKNKDKMRTHNKEYYEKNKDKLKEYNGERILCSCGESVRRDSISRHEKTDRHFNADNVYVV